MNHELEKSIKDKDINTFASLGMNMKIINPNLTKIELNNNIEQMLYKRSKLLKGLNELREFGVVDSFLGLAAETKIIYPDFDLKLRYGDWQKMKSNFNDYQTDNRFQETFMMALELKILDPGFDPELNNNDWKGIKNLMNVNRKSKNWISFSKITANIKILNPNFDLQITAEDWKNMRDKLDEYRDIHDWEIFSTLARNMKILAAEKVEVTDQGLKITMPKKKPKITQASPLPAKLELY